MPNKIFIMYVMSVCSKLQPLNITRHNNGHISLAFTRKYIKTFFEENSNSVLKLLPTYVLYLINLELHIIHISVN